MAFISATVRSTCFQFSWMVGSVITALVRRASCGAFVSMATCVTRTDDGVGRSSRSNIASVAFAYTDICTLQRSSSSLFA